MTKRIVGSIILAMTLLAHAEAQQDAELDQTGNNLARFIEARLPGWQHKRGTLIQGSRDVIVEVWTFPNRLVKVSMTRRKSVEEAHERLMTFAQEEGDARELKDFGDEAYSWGEEGSNIIFRRGKYTISVATIADVERDVDAQALTREQKRGRRKSEMRRLSRELAKHAANAIDAP
jgi:hypothetical protein